MSEKANLANIQSEKQSSLQPKLRFPEFQNQEGWRKAKLGDLVNILSGYAPNSHNLNSSCGFPYVKVEDMNNCSKYQEQSREYVKEDDRCLPVGAVMFPKRGAAIMANKVRIAAVPFYIDSNMMALSPNKASSLISEFLYYLVSAQKLSKIADTSSIPQINNKHIKSYRITVPSVPEQQKIADCLSSIDDRITAETQKLDTLKAHKKGLMQQLFPAEGENVPKLRFPEFDKRWLYDAMSRHVKLISGLHLAPSEYEDYRTEDRIPYFTGPSDFTNDIKEVSKWTSESKKPASRGNTLLTVKGSGVGQLMFLELPKVAMGRQLMAISANPDAEKFIFYCLDMKRQHFEALASGNMIPGISRGDILNTKVPFSENSRERRKISDCLSSLDRLITVHFQKINALKAHKKGLMQQLFPSLDEAKR